MDQQTNSSVMSEFCLFCFSLKPTKGKLLNYESMWQDPLSHMQMFISVPQWLAVMLHPAHLCCGVWCVQQHKSCRTPVSFILSRCFTVDVFLLFSFFLFFFYRDMKGHVRSCLKWMMIVPGVTAGSCISSPSPVFGLVSWWLPSCCTVCTLHYLSLFMIWTWQSPSQ